MKNSKKTAANRYTRRRRAAIIMALVLVASMIIGLLAFLLSLIGSALS